ncbi:universal stress protein [Actinomycetospora cinnamomea]|uniref:Nucleotide-binding universal stress UspA family protein n=1 Tax=Actinomycetospora cinnamomea TaxID=663609 RepID=A0A2U1F470_9PSEU|nr:universal stress protein [Actinomycetospora cinnamomea]PVZ06966.1 nucleotide-binding universal stress UspA family protein [Actinomycetospora cinnamomea]
MGEPDPVVVGVDEVGSAWDAVEWASAEAAARECPLAIVHACSPPVAPGPFAPGPEDAGVVVEALLREARERARRVAPEVEVTSRTIVGGPAPGLASQHAQLVVVGTRALGRIRSAIVGSVGVAVSSRATCPVVVVPPWGEVDPGPSRSRVVVGVEGPVRSSPALGVAFGAAAQRGVGVTALHAWCPRPPADLGGIGDDPAATEAAARHRLADAVTPWRRRFPDVDVRLRLVPDDPAHALTGESAGAALLVIGSRGHGCVTGALLGAVSHGVLRHARCPTSVVGPAATVRRRARAA